MPPSRYVLDTINNNAYHMTCNCPHCGASLKRGTEEYTTYCTSCWDKIHIPPFTQEEIDKARFEREMDDYE